MYAHALTCYCTTALQAELLQRCQAAKRCQPSISQLQAAPQAQVLQALQR